MMAGEGPGAEVATSATGGIDTTATSLRPFTPPAPQPEANGIGLKVSGGETVPITRPVDRLLSRLTGVRQTAPDRWIAICPAHADRSPSLSVRELPDGTLLLKDFAGCSAADVVHVVGLTLADLFHGSGQEYRSGLRKAPRVPATDLLLLASRELTVAVISLGDVVDKRTVDEDGWRRLAQAAARLGRLADEVRP